MTGALRVARILVVLGMTMVAAAWAQEARPAPKEATEPILKQLEAFRQGDFDTAYTFASADIQEQFDRPAFEQMVKGGYPEIAQSAFARIVSSTLAPDGHAYVAVKARSGPGLRGARHGLRFHAGAAALSRRSAGLARRERAGRSPGTRLRLLARGPVRGGPPARMAAHAAQGRLRRDRLASRVWRPRRLDRRADHAVRGNVSGRGAAAREPRRHLHAGPHSDEARDAGAAGAAPRQDPRCRGDVVPGLLRAERWQ